MIEIPGRFHSKATDHVVSGANEILDDNLNKKQSEINAENESFKDAQTELNEAQSEFNSEVREALGTGGNVDERIANAVNTEKERAEGAEEALDGRVDTLEDAVGTGGSVDSRIASAKSEIIGDAGSDYNSLGKLEDKILEEAATRLAQHYTKSETYSKTEINDHIDTPNQGYITAIADSNTTTANLKTLIDTAAGSDKEKADFIYRVGSWDGSQYDETVYSEYAWIDTDYVFLSKKSQIDEVFDISAYHANTPYVDLTAALGTNGANVPQSLRKGGMSIKFIQGSVQSSDNKYVQYRLVSPIFTTSIYVWQKQGAEVVVTQNTETDSEGNGQILVGRSVDGKYAGADKLIKIVGFATSQASYNNGDVYYNTSAHELRRRIDENNYEVVPFYKGALYTYSNALYVWDGVSLRSTVIINKNGTSKNLIISIGNNETLIPSLDNIDDLQKSVYGSKNLLDTSKSSKGLLNQDGTQGTQTYYRTSGLIRVQAGQKITRTGTLNALMEYDLNGNHISSTYTTSVPETRTQINDGYIRVTYSTSVEGNIQIEYGETRTPYVPYKLELNPQINLGELHLESIEEFMGGKTSDLSKVVVNREGLPITENITSDVIFTTGFYYDGNGEYHESSSYKSAKIYTTKGDILYFTASGTARYIVEFDEAGNVLQKRGYANQINCVAGSSYVWVAFDTNKTISKVEKSSNTLINNALELTYSTNLLDRTTFTEGGYINPSTGAVSAESTLGYTDYIPVKGGKKLICGDGINIIRYMRFIAAYDEYKRLISSAGSTDGTTGYTVPEGVAYVRVSVSLASLHDNSRINLVNANAQLLRFEPFNVSLMPKGTAERKEIEYNILNSPLTTLPNILKSVSYKPLGQLSKPYICFSTDDGYSQLATKTIPLFVSENVPITAYVMKGSPVFDSAENIQTIKNAIASGHCEIGQHGYTPFTQYNEDQLNAYLDEEKAYFDTLEIELKGSSTPTGVYNDMVNAVCGGRFGTNRNLDGAIKYGGTGQFANGPRSNIYALTTLGLKGHTLETNKLYIDNAFANNWLMMPYFHDFDFDETAEGQAFYEMVQELIQYAKAKGMTFITASQIPNII